MRLPTLGEVGREAVTVIAGALLAAYLVGRMPTLKAWIRRQWE